MPAGDGVTPISYELGPRQFVESRYEYMAGKLKCAFKSLYGASLSEYGDALEQEERWR
jgi:hypothetical protein